MLIQTNRLSALRESDRLSQPYINREKSQVMEDYEIQRHTETLDN